MPLSFDRNYKGHLIHPAADENPQTKTWGWRVLISWDEAGKRQYQTFSGSSDDHKSGEDAIAYAIALAMKWIDDGKPGLR